MVARLAAVSDSLDIGTLFVIAICVTSLLGMFLLFAYLQDRIAALAWWAAAYLIGGASGAIWWFGDPVVPFLPAGSTSALLFVAVGMIWSASRLFHGRPISWGGMFLGAGSWLAACTVPAFADSPAYRVIASSLIVGIYTFLIAVELWSERRKPLLRRWPAIFVPMLHGAIFLFPMLLATFSINIGGGEAPTTGWVAVFAIEVLLYVVGAAFMVLVLAKDRTVRAYKAVAATDPLSGLLNRRGVFEAAAVLMNANKARMQPVSVLAFDLDRFKSINDNFGHATGDMVLRLFAEVARKTMRAGDLIGRLGGEEFVAIIPGTLAEAAIAAERVRTAFAEETHAPGGCGIPATVSVGVACGSANAALDLLIARADAALYRAKANGRNCIELSDEAVACSDPVLIGKPPTVRQRIPLSIARKPAPVPVRKSYRRLAP